MKSEKLPVDARPQVGSRNNLKLRREGRMPAVLYGHNEPAMSLSLSYDSMKTLLRKHTKLVDLEGAVSGQALLQEVTWDPFHREVLHIDLLRVNADDRVQVEVPVLLKGEAPGHDQGGVVEQVLTEIEIEVAPFDIPEYLHVDVSKLNLGGALMVKDIYDLPAGAAFVTDADEMVVHCVRAAGDVDASSLTAAPGEPEVIGKKEAEEESEEK